MDVSVAIIVVRDPLPPYGVHVNMFMRACSLGHACLVLRGILNNRLNHALGYAWCHADTLARH
jgi:hypothetical protein